MNEPPPDWPYLLDIVTLAKDNPDEVSATILSTEALRASGVCRQIVVDGSQPQAASRIREICAVQRNTDYLYRPPNGISDAINFVLPQLHSRWMWLLNSGDRMYEGMPVPVLLHFIRESAASAILFQIIDEASGGMSSPPPMPFLWPPVFTWPSIPASLIRPQLLRDIGGFDTAFRTANDGEMWFRLMNRRDVKCDIINLPLTRFAPAGVSSNTLINASECLAFLRKHRWMILKRWLQSGLRYFEAKRKFKRRIARARNRPGSSA